MHMVHLKVQVTLQSFYTDPLNCFPQKNVYKTLITNTNISFSNAFYGSCLLLLIQKSYMMVIAFDSVIAYGNRAVFGSIMIDSSVPNVPNYNLTINNSRSSNAIGASGLVITTTAIDATNIESCSFCHSLPETDLTILIINSSFTYNNGNNPDITKGSISFSLDYIQYSAKVRIESTEISHNMITSDSALYFSSLSNQNQLRVTLFNVTVNNNSMLYFVADEDNVARFAAVNTELVTTLVPKQCEHY